MKIIIVGSGITGSVAARVLAEAGNSVEVWEKKPYVGGAVYDKPDSYGVHIHVHGPHIFHTNSQIAYDFLSRFTEWYGFSHKVLGEIGGSLCPIPFNYTSIEKCFDKDTADIYKRKLSEFAGEEPVVTIGKLRTAEDQDLQSLSDYVYKNVFENYTLKQWGMPPERLGEEVMGRVPVRASYEDRYFTDKYQGIPKNGYTAMILNILDHPNIEVRTSYDALQHMTVDNGKIVLDGSGLDSDTAVIYCGCLEELLKYKFGKLPYRSLRFETELKPSPFQPVAVVNYPNSHDYTRISQYSHFEPGHDDDDKCTIMYEYPIEYEPGCGLDAYYPVPLDENKQKYQLYADEVSSIKNFYPAGRLGSYKYINMDVAVVEAVKLAEKIILSAK